MTDGGADDDFVRDECFSLVEAHFTVEQIVGLTMLIAWENSSARFNRALNVESQNLWARESGPAASGDEAEQPG